MWTLIAKQMKQGIMSINYIFHLKGLSITEKDFFNTCLGGPFFFIHIKFFFCYLQKFSKHVFKIGFRDQIGLLKIEIQS